MVKGDEIMRRNPFVPLALFAVLALMLAACAPVAPAPTDSSKPAGRSPSKPGGTWTSGPSHSTITKANWSSFRKNSERGH